MSVLSSARTVLKKVKFILFSNRCYEVKSSSSCVYMQDRVAQDAEKNVWVAMQLYSNSFLFHGFIVVRFSLHALNFMHSNSPLELMDQIYSWKVFFA